MNDKRDSSNTEVKGTEHWSSYYAFIFAAIGSAVGIGNIWRYPYIVGTNGGGAFLLIYLIVVFTFGLAFMVLELIVGRHYQKPVITSLSKIKSRFKYFGIFIVIVTFCIVSYYLVILGWILSYFIFSLVGLINYYPFEEFTNSYYPVLSFIVIVAINYVILRVDIRKGIERISRIGVLLLMAIIIPLTILGVLMPGSDRGIDFYLKPDFSKLSDPNMWSVAFGQAFFSLSIGMGVLVTYGSYLQQQEENDKTKGVKKWQISLVTSSSIVIISDISIAFLAGLMIFSFVFANDMDPTHGTSLVFRVMPAVFSNIGEDYGSIVIAPLFFFLLLLAGITSSISMLQVPVSSFQDSLNMNRIRLQLSSHYLF